MHLRDIVDSVAIDETSSETEFEFECNVEETPPQRTVRSVEHSKEPGRDELISTIQEQQRMLEQMKKCHESMELRQSQLENKIAQLEEKIEGSKTPPETPISKGKRKRIVTRALSVSIVMLQ